MRRLSDYRVLVVPGLHDSGPAHWQTRWQQLYPFIERVAQARWDTPDLLVWSERLDEVLRRSDQPALIVAHRFGCLATMPRAGLGARNLAAALLVAPADPDRFGVPEDLLNVRQPCPSIVLASINDPRMPIARAAYWAQRRGSKLINAGALGHINAESGLGQWPAGISFLQLLVRNAGADTDTTNLA